MQDLIIVGGGPVGCYLAKEFSENGYKVLVLEEHEEIGEPVACSGHVSNLIWNFIPELKDKIVENEIKGAKFHVKNKSYTFETNKIHSYVVNRKKLDKEMSKLAKKAGVEILTSHKVKKIVKNDSNIEVYVKYNNNSKKFKGRILAGCDGVFSTVRKFINAGEPKKILKGILCYTRERDSGDYVEVYPSVTKDFFAWRIPRGRKVEYGLSTAHPQNLYKELVKFLSKFGIKKEEILGFQFGAIPMGMVDKISSGRIFLVGDSTGGVKPFTGGGIIYGLTSAKIASKHINPENPKTIEIYKKMLKKCLGRELFFGNLFKNFYYLPERLQETILNIGSKKIKSFHMDKPSQFLSNFI